MAFRSGTSSPPVAFAVSVSIFLVVGLVVLSPVILGIVVGGLVVLIAQRPYSWLVRKLHGRRSAAAVLVTLVLTLCVLLPLGLVLYLAALQIIEAARSLQQYMLDNGGAMSLVTRLPKWLQHMVGPEVQRLGTHFANVVPGIAAMVPAVAGSVATWLVQTVLTIVSMFYFFRDGPELVDLVYRASPLSRSDTEVFMSDTVAVAHGVLYGNVLTAIAQGFASWLGYLIVGAPQPLLLGVLTGLAAFVPVVGTAVVWGPTAIGLGLSSEPWRPIVLVVWGIVIIGAIDNILRPLMSKGHAHVHGLAVFASLFGGVALLGVQGLVLGPLLMGLAATAMRRCAARSSSLG